MFNRDFNNSNISLSHTAEPYLNLDYLRLTDQLHVYTISKQSHTHRKVLDVTQALRQLPSQRVKAHKCLHQPGRLDYLSVRPIEIFIDATRTG